MYNGIGLQTPRGSGTNGYIQTNKFFVKAKTGKVAHTTRGYEADQGTAGITKKPNKDILEHDRKRQIEVKLLELEDKLIEQGYTDVEIAEKLDEARQVLEAAAASETSGGPSALLAVDAKVSDTQSHQIAARKEKQMETLRAALGIAMSDPHEQNEEVGDDDVPRSDRKNDNDNSKWSEKREHAFLDRDFSSKKDVLDDEKDNEKHAVKSKLKEERDEPKRHKKEKKRRKHHDYSSDTEDSGKAVKGTRKKHHKAKRSDSETETDSSDSEDYRHSKKHKKSRKYPTDDSSSNDSYDDKKKSRNSGRKKNGRRSDSGSDYSDSSDDDYPSDDERSKRSLNNHKKSIRRGSDSDYSSTDDDGSRKHSSKKKVEKFNKSSKKYHSDDTDSDSDDSPRHGRNVGKGHSRKEVEDSRWGQNSDLSSPKRGKENLHGKRNRRHDSNDEDDGDGEVKPRESLVRSEVSKQGGSRRSAIDDYVEGDKDKSKTDDIHGQRRKRLGDSESDSDEGRRHKKDRRYNRNESDSDDGIHEKINKREDRQYTKSRNQDVDKERKDEKYHQPSSRYGDARRYEDKSDRRRDDSSRYIKSRGEDKYSERERGRRGRTEEDGQGGSDSKRARYDKYDDHRSSERKRYRD